MFEDVKVINNAKALVTLEVEREDFQYPNFLDIDYFLNIVDHLKRKDFMDTSVSSICTGYRDKDNYILVTFSNDIGLEMTMRDKHRVDSITIYSTGNELTILQNIKDFIEESLSTDWKVGDVGFSSDGKPIEVVEVVDVHSIMVRHEDGTTVNHYKSWMSHLK